MSARMSPHYLFALGRSFDHGIGQREPEMVAFLDHIGRIESALEIGAGRGGTTRILCAIASTVVSVDKPDTDDGIPLAECLARNEALAAHCFNFTGILRPSEDEETRMAVMLALNGIPLDLLFIDGDHREESVQRDYDLYAPLVRKGGLVAFHDINSAAHPGVARVWHRCRQGRRSWEFSDRADWGGIGVLEC